jgi:hypothetical protein
MTVRIVPPRERTCTRCGRQDVWDAETENWIIEQVDGERQAGRPHCVHEWDINGTYNPVGTTE